MSNMSIGLRLLAFAFVVDLSFHNVLENYKPFKEDGSAAQAGTWIKANKTVEDIGGWKQYAKEAATPAAPEVAPGKSPRVEPSKASHQHGVAEPKK
jgi:hypothetical protein